MMKRLNKAGGMESMMRQMQAGLGGGAKPGGRRPF
jgi:hypothetical protein